MMGVDAIMGVTTKEQVTKEQVLAWSINLVDAFGASQFWMDRDSKDHALSLSEEWEDLLPNKKESETFMYVNLSDRYYGKGYERGSCPDILMIALWLQQTIPGASVWYGGDSSCNLEPFGDLEQQELWDHFVAVGHRPYRKGWTDSLDDRHFSTGIPHCKFCGDFRMSRSGIGASYGSYYCHGCEFGIFTNDAGEVWRVSREVGGRSTVRADQQTPMDNSDDCPVLDESFVTWKRSRRIG